MAKKKPKVMVETVFEADGIKVLKTTPEAQHNSLKKLTPGERIVFKIGYESAKAEQQKIIDSLKEQLRGSVKHKNNLLKAKAEERERILGIIRERKKYPNLHKIALACINVIEYEIINSLREGKGE